MIDDPINAAVNGGLGVSPAAKPVGTVPARGVARSIQLVDGNRDSSVERSRQAISEDAPDAAISQAVTGQTVTDAQQTVYLFLNEKAFYCDLVLLDGLEGDVAVPPATHLQPGRGYRVRTSISRVRYDRNQLGNTRRLTQTELIVERGLELSLAPAEGEAVHAIGSIENVHARLDIKVRRDWFHDFRFVVPPDALAMMVRLNLWFREADGAASEQVVASLECNIEGASLSADVPRPRPVYLPLSAVPPEHVRFLHVMANGSDELAFVAFNKRQDTRALTPMPRPALPMDGRAAKDGTETDALHYLRSLRHIVQDLGVNDAGGLPSWLDQVLKAHRERACIIIVDQSGSEIPWEMLKLKGNRYLGASAVVARWTEAQYYGVQVDLGLEEAAYVGRVAAYVHPEDAAHVGRHCPTLFKLVSSCCDTPQDLENSLFPLQGAPPVGLVYLSSGGLLQYGDETEAAATLLELYPPSVFVRFDNAEGGIDPRPVFFANAPHSGRVFSVRGATTGLAKAALSQIAAGYIGTLGPVDRAFAARQGEDFLASAATTSGVRPAERLRDWRAKAADRLAAGGLAGQELEQATREFYYAFMYVYYGNPQACLRVAPIRAKPPSPAVESTSTAPTSSKSPTPAPDYDCPAKVAVAPGGESGGHTS